MTNDSNSPGPPSPTRGDLGGLEVWQFIHDKLSASTNVLLLYVLDSEGSSPGRQGFKMAVAANGDILGTIGGGIMEHKLVEKAKMLLGENNTSISLAKQYHDKQQPTGQSGMICSGSQMNAFLPLSSTDRKIIETILQGERITLQLSPRGIALVESSPQGMHYSLEFQTETDWRYHEKLNERPVIHIIGGGHVSLALSELMCFLGFYSKVYDDRPELNTILQNFFANEKIIIPAYEQLGEFILDCSNDYAVIMTLGYRTDKIALKQLLDKGFYYLGMMGSDNKIETLFKELRTEGVSEESLKKIFTPVGIDINSKTSQEIAVSIAAEIIREKNKELSTGRQRS